MSKSKVEEAVACFNNRFNCAQAILSTYCEEFGLDKETAFKVSCGLGAGMGRLQETCGAVSGAYLLIGLMHGKYTIDGDPAKEKTYALVQEFARRFEERNNTTKCRDLLEIDLINDDKRAIAEQVAKVCPKMVQDAAEIIEEMLLS